MPAPYSGGCQCGQVRYDLIDEPLRLIACHCSECQNQSGSAFGMSMIVKTHDLKITGVTKSYTRTADSGNKNTSVFCPDCGVRIHNTPHNINGILTLKPGTLDDTSWLSPTAMVWTKSGQGWFPVPDGVKDIKGQP